MKRIWCLLILAGMLLAGCAGRHAPEPQPEPVQLRVVTSYGVEDGNRRNYEAAVAAYEKATGNRIIDNSDTSNEEWKARVLADFETGSEPDVLFFFANADAEPFIQANKVVSIQEIRRFYPDYGSNMDDSRLPVASDGRNYAMPMVGYWEYLYVNREVLKQCGVPVPGTDYTWERFLEDCQAVREKGFTPVACSLAEVPHYLFEFAVLNNGPTELHMKVPTLDADGRLVEDSAARMWLAALEDIKQLYETGCLPANTLTAGDAQTVAAFAEDQAAFLIDGSWKVGFFNDNYPDLLDHISVCYVPAKQWRRATDTIGGISTGFFITRKAWEDPRKRDAAAAFVSQMTSNEVIRSFVTTEMTALKQEMPQEGLNPLEQAAADAKKGTTALIGSVQDTISSEARSSLLGSIQKVVTGEMTAKEALETALQFN